MNIFNTHLTFNKSELYNKINMRIAERKTAYVCVCDSSVIARLQHDLEYREVINGSFVNTCDGSLICTLASKIYGKGLESVNGPEIFEYYIHHAYRQVIIGNTDEIVARVRTKLAKEGRANNDSYIKHIQVPFCKVDEFNYKEIASEINAYNPDIIWVSLGNPKQEVFCRKIEPLLAKGVLFGIGAALNFWVGDLALPKFHIGSLRFIWLTRIFQDPIRQIKMNWAILKVLPKMYFEEKRFPLGQE